MYSDSIKKKQQELLDVLSKKASGKNIIPARDLILRQTAKDKTGAGATGNGFLTPDQVDLISDIQNMSEEDRRKYESEYIDKSIDESERELERKNRILDRKEFDELGLGYDPEAWHKKKDQIRYDVGALSLLGANKQLAGKFLDPLFGDQRPTIDKLNKDVPKSTMTTSVDTNSLKPSVSGTTPVLPISEQYLKTPVPLEKLPEIAPIDPTPDDSEPVNTTPAQTPAQTPAPAPVKPTTPAPAPAPTPAPAQTPVKPATPAPKKSVKEDVKKGNPEIDPVALAKLLISKALQHKATSLGGLGGAGLGLMLGKSIPGRLLWGLLGGLGGAGLGYAAEKYIK